MTFTFFCKDHILERDIFLIKVKGDTLYSYYSISHTWTYRDGSRFPYEYFKRK